MDKCYYIELYEIYKSLLTEKQSEMFSLYACDLSLGEISEMKNVSRQGVADAINKTKKILSSYEEKLGVYAFRAKVKNLADEFGDEKAINLLLKDLEG